MELVKGCCIGGTGTVASVWQWKSLPEEEPETKREIEGLEGT
jgi:hypothetical protein